MKKAENFLFILLIIFLSKVSFSQNMEIKYIGNCGYLIKLDSVEIFTDFPYVSGAYGYMEYDIDSIQLGKPNQYFIYTHLHKDHYSKKIVKELKIKTFRPRMSSKKRKRYLEELQNKYGIEILSFKTKHRFSLKHFSYGIKWKGKTIFLFGDTEMDFPDFISEKIDIMFITDWQIPRLKEFDFKYDIEHIIPYHLRPNISGNVEYLTNYLNEHLKFLNNKPNYIILNQYQNIIIE